MTNWFQRKWLPYIRIIHHLATVAKIRFLGRILQSIIITIQFKFRFTVILFLATVSLQIFAHTKAPLVCLVQKLCGKGAKLDRPTGLLIIQFSEGVVGWVQWFGEKIGENRICGKPFLLLSYMYIYIYIFLWFLRTGRILTRRRHKGAYAYLSRRCVSMETLTALLALWGGNPSQMDTFHRRADARRFDFTVGDILNKLFNTQFNWRFFVSICRSCDMMVIRRTDKSPAKLVCTEVFSNARIIKPKYIIIQHD